MHDRIIKENIFNKLNKIVIKSILNVIDFKMMWNILNQRYVDQKFIKKHVLYFQILFITLNIYNYDLQKYIRSFNKTIVFHERLFEKSIKI